MAKFMTELTEATRKFIESQRMFFTATAPNQGRINLSPKGLDTFRILSDKQVAYMDLTGSGCETAAHITENGRLTLMMCSFDEKPMILRLYGKGRVVRPRDPDWASLRPHFKDTPGERQIIVLDIESAMTSCGWSIPFYAFQGERSKLVEYACEKGEAGLVAYRRKNNKVSIDGLPSGMFDDY